MTQADELARRLAGKALRVERGAAGLWHVVLCSGGESVTASVGHANREAADMLRVDIVDVLACVIDDAIDTAMRAWI